MKTNNSSNPVACKRFFVLCGYGMICHCFPNEIGRVVRIEMVGHELGGYASVVGMNSRYPLKDLLPLFEQIRKNENFTQLNYHT